MVAYPGGWPVVLAGLAVLTVLEVLAGCSGATRARQVAAPAAATASREAQPTEPAPGEGSAETRISYYEERLAGNPNLYPLHTLLGRAYLDRARETHDPAWVIKARQAAQRSLDLQNNFDAMKLMMQVEKYSHRFESAISWARRAAKASPGGSAATEPEITAALVEAHLALGQPDEARTLLPPAGAPVDRFYVAAAMAQVLAAQKRVDEAVKYYLRARELALHDKSPSGVEGARWGRIMAGGVLLDNGRLAEARPHFEAAAREGWTPLLGIHQAEVHEAEGRLAEALAAYEKVLGQDPDPEVRRQAFRMARKLGDEKRAQAHFTAAERALRAPLALGEIYSLGALAQLYADAETKLDEALELARRNLEWKRDPEAHETLAEIEEKQARLQGRSGASR